MIMQRATLSGEASHQICSVRLPKTESIAVKETQAVQSFVTAFKSVLSASALKYAETDLGLRFT